MKFEIIAGCQYDKDGQPITQLEGKLNTFRSMLAANFGGYTEYNTKGGWIDDKGNLVVETGVKFGVMHSIENCQTVYWAEKLRDLLNQNCVVLIEEGTHQFI